MLAEYFPILLFLLVGLGVGVAPMALGKVLGPSNPTAEKLAPYECGMPATGSPWVSPNIRFYIFCLLFVVFDVEALFVFPWAVNFRALGMEGFAAVAVFVGVIAVGLAYAWRKGTLKWE